MQRVINLDNAAATPIHPQVKAKMIDYLENVYANPSSQHRLGDRAAEALDAAREQVALLINAEPREIVFGSGGTESVNHAVKGVAFAKRDKGQHIITSNIEHNAVLRTLRALRLMDWRVTSLEVDQHGRLDPAAVEKAITDQTVLITVMHANNEIGTIEPIAEIGEIARKHKIIFHTDAVASTGIVPVDVKAMNVDLLSLSANQFYGPSGVGALYVKRGTALWPLLDGGVQEQNKRAGTQNMLGIVGMGVAAELARADMDSRAAHARVLKERMASGLKKGIEHLIFNGHPEYNLPHLLSVSVGFIEGESMMIMLDEDGVAVATRSACASGALQASHVLLGIGLDFADAQGTLVFTFSPDNTADDVDYVVEKLPPIVERLREMSPLYKK
jgi:cysteine desulfurase